MTKLTKAYPGDPDWQGGQPMSERITEAELRDWETDESPYMRKFGKPERRLVREVRRLRELIVELDAAVEVAISGRIPPGERVVYIAEYAPGIFGEARAIREEQAKPLT